MQGAAHMITEHIKLAALYDPVKELNLTHPRRLLESEVIDTVEKLCKNNAAWKPYGGGKPSQPVPCLNQGLPVMVVPVVPVIYQMISRGLQRLL